MNSKIIAAGVVVALCAVALIGVGYAYTATMTNENAIDGKYVVLDVADSGKATAFFKKESSKVAFNTTISSGGILWTVSSPVNGVVSGQETDYLSIIGRNVSDSDGSSEGIQITLDLKTTVDPSNTLTLALLNNSTEHTVGTTIIFENKNSSTDKIIYQCSSVTDLEDGNKQLSWTITESSPSSNFTVGKDYKVSLDIESFSSNGRLSDSNIEFNMVLTYTGSDA